METEELKKCPYYSCEDITPWHSEIFDHPTYQVFCSKSGEKKKIFHIHCFRCSFFKEKRKNERK